MSEDRDKRGRFVVGNPGGPGRPRRAIEREYLAAISEAVSLDDWRAIVGQAVKAAKEGDDKARAWLARYVIGDNPITLTELLARELLDIDADLEAQVKAEELSEGGANKLIAWTEPTFVERARAIQARLAKGDGGARTRAEAVKTT